MTTETTFLYQVAAKLDGVIARTWEPHASLEDAQAQLRELDDEDQVYVDEHNGEAPRAKFAIIMADAEFFA